MSLPFNLKAKLNWDIQIEAEAAAHGRRVADYSIRGSSNSRAFSIQVLIQSVKRTDCNSDLRKGRLHRRVRTQYLWSFWLSRWRPNCWKSSPIRALRPSSNLLMREVQFDSLFLRSDEILLALVSNHLGSEVGRILNFQVWNQELDCKGAKLISAYDLDIKLATIKRLDRFVFPMTIRTFKLWRTSN